MELTLMGAKKIHSNKTNSNWVVMHVAYSDPSYITGYAVDSVVVEPDKIQGELVEGCKVQLNRSPDGKRLLSVVLTV